MKRVLPILRKFFIGALIFFILLALVSTIVLVPYIRTLQSLKRVPGTNAYTLDFYAKCQFEKIAKQGIEPDNLEASFVKILCPKFLEKAALSFADHFLDESLEVIPAGSQRCSAVYAKNSKGEVFLGRNFDWHHDATLILRIHNGKRIQSISVIDLHYLNLDREDLDQTSLFERVALLATPYFLMDGMSHAGISICDLSAPAKPGRKSERPNIIHSTLMRLVLEKAQTTQQAIDLIEQYNVHFVDAESHFLIGDAFGDSAVVEFIEGKTQITRTKSTWQVCTNHRVFGKSEIENDQVCNRYDTASAYLDNIGTNVSSNDVMKVMNQVSVKDWTMWSSVYNLKTGDFFFVHDRNYQNIFKSGVENGQAK